MCALHLAADVADDFVADPELAFSRTAYSTKPEMSQPGTTGK
jgi:hypothetical protein